MNILRNKAVLVLGIIALILAAAIFFGTDYLESLMNGSADNSERNSSNNPSEGLWSADYPDYLAEVMILEKLLEEGSGAASGAAGSSRSPGASGASVVPDLVRLAQGEGAVSYLAYLALAERSAAGEILGELRLDPEDEEEVPGARADIFYRRALDLYASADVRFKLAAWLAANDFEEEAQSEYLLLLPDSEALKYLAELGADPLEISRVLSAGSHWAAAVEFIKEALLELEVETDLTERQRPALIARLGESLARQEKFDEALPYLREAYDNGNRDIAWLYARALEKTGAVAAATALYEELGEAGAYRLGTILLERGSRGEAARTLALSPDPAAKWQSARLWEELGNVDNALEVYGQLARGESRYKDHAAFRAYVLMSRRNLSGAEEMLDILCDYPIWSMKATGKVVWGEIPELQYEKPLFLLTAEAMRESGRSKMADIEMAIGISRAGTAEMLALGDKYLEEGDYFTATRWGIRSLGSEKTMPGYYLAYQRPFEDLVLESAEKYNLDPYLIWSVMREESHFRPGVDSWVGARGLMQIMPATGQEIAGRKGMTITDNDLLRPEINIDFGSFYLRSMLDLFGNDVDKALAAYNGGQGNVRKWGSSPLGATPDDFPTAIAFLETREYLSKVLNTYYTYLWLYN